MEPNVIPTAMMSFTPEMEAAYAKARKLLLTRGISTLEGAGGGALTDVLLRHPQVTSALIGASSVRQLDNSLDALTAVEVDEQVAKDEHEQNDARVAHVEPAPFFPFGVLARSRAARSFDGYHLSFLS